MQEKQLLHHCDIYPFSNIICYYENKTTIYSDENKWTEEYIIMTIFSVWYWNVLCFNNHCKERVYVQIQKIYVEKSKVLTLSKVVFSTDTIECYGVCGI